MTPRGRGPGGPAAGLAWGLGASVAIHLGGFLALTAVQAPPVDVTLSLPDQVAFGLTEEVAMAPAAAPTNPEPPAPPEPPEPAPVEPEVEAASDGDDDAPPDAGPSDGGAPDAGVQDAGPPDGGLGGPSDAAVGSDGGASGDGGIPDAGGDAGTDGGDAGEPDAGTDEADQRRPRVAEAGGDVDATDTVLPAGAQLALRLDLRALRASSLREPVAALLEVLPDWRALLEGSGVEPLSDLDRLLLASPNLRRSRTLVAGRTLDGDETVRQAVARLAAHRGEKAPWRTRLGGVPVAPWHDQDRTVREVALLGGGVFAITRPEDLPALLAVARARAAPDEAGSADDGPGDDDGDDVATDGDDDPGTAPAPPAGGTGTPTPAEALLALPRDAVLSFEAEGARAYVAGGQAAIVPERLSLTVAPAGGDLALEVTGRWSNTDEAEAAASYWGRRIRAYAGHPLAGLFGVAGALQRTELDRDGTTVRARTTAAPGELDRLLRQARGFFAGPSRPPQPSGTP